MNPNAPFSPGQGTPGRGACMQHDARWRAAAPPAGPRTHDPATHELPVRYARGAPDRSDLLERSADLGGPPTPDGTLPGQPPAAEQG
jgi:hypothetical protein